MKREADSRSADRRARAGTVASDERRATSDEAGLYVHVPVCRSKCRYCGFYSVPAGGVNAGRLVDGLLRELDRCEGIEFRTAYIGGGSPSALPASELLRLVRRVRERCPHGTEFTVECNPGQVDADLLAQLREAGGNRLSFGAQSLVARELELLGRGHSVEQIEAAVLAARQAGFENVGLDLIFAIPGSTLADWQASLEAAVALNIEHVSAYSLSFESGTVFETWRRAGRLTAVDEELDRAMYEWTIGRLDRAGLGQYEISNFARPGFECRHNLGYWANRPYVGIGPAAASYLTAGAGGWRITNDADIERYLVAVEDGRAAPAETQAVSPDDAVCETAVLNLRRRDGIDLAEFQQRTGRDAMRIFAEPIGRYREMGLIEVTDRAVRLTGRALPIADTILCDFAALE
ncbi:MAG TPA: radical SAM family heme chaperone HemW [Sedimentisphaerales bacterium]|nr:radical SAM family heme chaperone HemW [Sedimentisphaerales bacterium]